MYLIDTWRWAAQAIAGGLRTVAAAVRRFFGIDRTLPPGHPERLGADWCDQQFNAIVRHSLADVGV